MRFSSFDTEVLAQTATAEAKKNLSGYQKQLEKITSTHNTKRPEYSLVHVSSPEVHDTLSNLATTFKGIKHLVVIGIGGSSLGVEALHTALGEKKVRLSVLDTIAPYETDILLSNLKRYKKPTQIAVCIISKSGGTAETVINAAVVLEALEGQFGKAVYDQTICIGNPGTDLMSFAKRKKTTAVVMPEAVGGRFSAATEVGLVPLTLLGHDADAYMAGLLEANEEGLEVMAEEGALRLLAYLEAGYRQYNFFAFDKRLAQLGAWYRQLFAESLGKAETRAKKPLKLGMVPTITTAVELHSVGQLYLSGFEGVYTEFVTFEDDVHDHKIPKTGIGKQYAKYSSQEVSAAIYAGVVGAYQDKKLPYRSVIFDETSLEYSLGQFMGLRMREIMYLAKLLEVNAFNQPNVESYKKKTNKILGL